MTTHENMVRMVRARTGWKLPRRNRPWWRRRVGLRLVRRVNRMAAWIRRHAWESELARQRMVICKACDQYDEAAGPRCAMCGCALELKTMLPKRVAACPLGLW